MKGCSSCLEGGGVLEEARKATASHHNEEYEEGPEEPSGEGDAKEDYIDKASEPGTEGYEAEVTPFIGRGKVTGYREANGAKEKVGNSEAEEESVRV